MGIKVQTVNRGLLAIQALKAVMAAGLPRYVHIAKISYQMAVGSHSTLGTGSIESLVVEYVTR